MTGEGARRFVHRYLPGASTDAPALLLLHGTGGDEHDLIGLGRMLDPEAALLSPRGKVLEHGMPRFFRRTAEGVFDVEDLHRRTLELADFVAAAAAEYGFEPARLLGVGYSNGANIAASLLLLRPMALAGAILMRPMMVPRPIVEAGVPEPEADAAPRLAGVPVLIAAGRLDPIARPEESERLAALLRAAGADVSVHWEEAGHGLESGEIDAAREWLKQTAWPSIQRGGRGRVSRKAGGRT